MDRDVAERLPIHTKALRRYAMALVGNPSEADDLVQECLCRALAYVERGSEIRNLRAYLFTILHNVRMDGLSAQRRNGRPQPLDEEATHVAQMPSQYARMECRDLDRLLRKLPTEQLEVLLLVGLEGFSYQAASETIGVPIGTVMSRLSRGRSALRRLMGGERRRMQVQPARGEKVSA